MRQYEFSALRDALDRLQFEVKDLRAELAARRFLAELKARFNPAQPRAPRGTSIGGRWVDSGSGWSPAKQTDLFDRRLDRPDDAAVIRTGGGGSRLGVGGNRPPPEFTTMRQVFPGLQNAPAGAMLAPIDSFLGLSAPGEEANLAVSQLQFQSIYREIRKLDPSYRPPDSFQSLEQMSWEARKSYLGEMLLDHAAALYKVRGEIEPLQVETLRFMQQRVDVRYTEAVAKYEAGELDVRFGKNEAIGNYIDKYVRQDLTALYKQQRVSTAPGQQVRVNSRAYATSERTFKVPDMRVGRVAFDMTMTAKKPGSDQIRGFFSADFRPTIVVIVRPTALGRGHTYAIKRPNAADRRTVNAKAL